MGHNDQGLPKFERREKKGVFCACALSFTGSEKFGKNDSQISCKHLLNEVWFALRKCESFFALIVEQNLANIKQLRVAGLRAKQILFNYYM